MDISNIGTYYQGQLISITLETKDTDTSEQKALVANNEVYIGIYSDHKDSEKYIMSTADGTIKKTSGSNGNVTLTATLTPLQTKSMLGVYNIEMLIKSADNSFANPSENVIKFTVEKRKLSEVIK